MGFFEKIVPTGIPIVGDLIGGILGDQAQERSDDRNIQATDAANASNQALQREFAQMGIRWRVEDAKAAGLHPLAALGASGAQASPSFQAFTGQPRTGVADAVGRMGQNISRAMAVTSTAQEREAKALQLRGLDLDNQIKQAELDKLRGPSFPGSVDPLLSGQGDSSNALVIDEPLRRIASDPSDLSKEAGAIQDYQIVQTGNGYSVVPGKSVKQAIEDSPMEYQWLARAATRTYPHPVTGEKMYMDAITGRLKPYRQTLNYWSKKGWEKMKKFRHGRY